ncbi:hypothetical protein QLY38_07430 [Cronobacter sakazakii]|uniref:hypothetical protein n=1 Tax=Cronobacter sakazakii TaxID=28141 RepID=UPI0021574541|nr:hypothetical protein [Cronobacter sakazakii]MCU7758043.1 hypothetical protein [Cronobacter sakazakii]MDI7265178.1 hypothetical protein [Cronobacter sakazakii]MDI7279531.1 hypothetical protein [Cronobacter sakazakii]MDI7284496.1 hypothetical protein [Cronobacter sakazakii]MDI7288224.1 hypothetical protein [Cronobacter sakazakii]
MATYPNVNDANRYARDVVAGKILACRYVKLACQRHLNDLERAKDQRWPYRFDRDKAERFCRFSQKMPHTSGEWARKKLRLTLEDWQKFCFCVSFGWVRKSDGLRRFQEIYIEVLLFYGVRRGAKRQRSHHKGKSGGSGWKVAPRNNYMTEVLARRKAWTRYTLQRALRKALRPPKVRRVRA